MAAALEHSFICRDTLRRELSGWLLTESLYPPRLRMAPHRHENAYFGIVVRGSYSENNRAKPRVCGPSSLVLHPEGHIHSVQFHDSPTRIFRVELKQAALEKVRPGSKLFDAPEQLSSTSLSWLVTRLRKEFSEPDDVAPLAIEGIILEVIAEASRAMRKAERNCPPWLETAREFLHENFTKPLRLDEIAAAADVHPVYLAREFRRQYRITLGEYVRGLRVEAACRAISATDAPLAEIAASLGFSDQSHMGRHFKRLTGCTPTQYRAAGRRSG
ncbi:MAG TPA: AraC family transcriptional regulator [Pyrinomonadaceae bacterium]|nr:AraC family transcriptional regulator [Pyrinomonadaceae bacterium]